MTTATATLTPQVVWPHDGHDTKGCARCRRAIRDLDVIVTTPQGHPIHIHCLGAAERRTLEIPAPPTDDAERCWYAAGTPQACPFRIEAHNLCVDHHGQLCRDGKKPRSRRQPLP
jgi:hypothetical protein